MSFAYLPLFTGDYLRDTRHLTPLRHGVYLLALMHCWDSKGPMPLDEQECAGICNCRSADEVDAMRYVLSRYFVCMDDGHYNARMASEVAKCEQISGKRRDGGLKSAQARREKARRGKREQEFNLSSTQVQLESVSPSPSPSPSPFLKNPSPPSLHQGRVVGGAPPPAKTPPPPFSGDNIELIPPRAIVLIAQNFELPDAWGKDAEKLGWKGQAILKEAEKFRQYWVSGKGAGKRRTVKGWRQGWSYWLEKAGAMA